MATELNPRKLSQQLERLAPGHRLCAGCGAPIIVRQVLAAIDEPVIVACATGCLEVGTTIYPYTAWRVPWIHNAFENAASTISGVEAAYRSMVRQGKIPEQDVKFISSVAVEPAPPHRVFAHRDGGFYLSFDEGVSWTPADGPPYGPVWRGLVFAPGDPPVLYAATSGGLYREVGGAMDSLRWQPAAGTLGRANIASLAVGTDGDRVVLYAGTSGVAASGSLARVQSLATDGTPVNAGVML